MRATESVRSRWHRSRAWPAPTPGTKIQRRPQRMDPAGLGAALAVTNRAFGNAPVRMNSDLREDGIRPNSFGRSERVGPHSCGQSRPDKSGPTRRRHPSE